VDGQHPIIAGFAPRLVLRVNAVIGRIGDLVWSAFVTRRDERIRIISVRRARNEEKAAYLQD
jgi:uncharacterized DUF497 family protein